MTKRPRSALSKADREGLSRLVHDVGKYIARTARNLPAPLTAPLPAPLFEMLLADLYGNARDARPSQRFAELAAGLPTAASLLGEVAEKLRALDALEPSVRRAEPAAIDESVQLALAIERMLREGVAPTSASKPSVSRKASRKVLR